MFRRVLGVVTLAWSLAMPRDAAAQAPATVITFEMQVNLTNLQPDLERVGLFCAVSSSSLAGGTAPLLGGPLAAGVDPSQIPGSTWLYPTQGKLVATMTAQVPIPASALAPDAIGKPASYNCILAGYSASSRTINSFSPSSPNPAFRLNPPPQVPLTGTFVW